MHEEFSVRRVAVTVGVIVLVPVVLIALLFAYNAFVGYPSFARASVQTAFHAVAATDPLPGYRVVGGSYVPQVVSDYVPSNQGFVVIHMARPGTVGRWLMAEVHPEEPGVSWMWSRAPLVASLAPADSFGPLSIEQAKALSKEFGTEAFFLGHNAESKLIDVFVPPNSIQTVRVTDGKVDVVSSSDDYYAQSGDALYYDAAGGRAAKVSFSAADGPDSSVFR